MVATCNATLLLAARGSHQQQCEAGLADATVWVGRFLTLDVEVWVSVNSIIEIEIEIKQ